MVTHCEKIACEISSVCHVSVWGVIARVKASVLKEKSTLKYEKCVSGKVNVEHSCSHIGAD